MPSRDSTLVGDDEWLTQHGVIRPGGHRDYRNCLRTDPGKAEADMSLIRGRLSPEEAGVARLGRARRSRRDAARHTTARRLRVAGFRVEHTPRFPRAPMHVSVYWDRGHWNEETAKLFDGCFVLEGEEG
jgi:hypothetical protein